MTIMAEFKVGDRVRVGEKYATAQHHASWIEIGALGMVERVRPGEAWPITVELFSGRYEDFDPDELALVVAGEVICGCGETVTSGHTHPVDVISADVDNDDARDDDLCRSCGERTTIDPHGPTCPVGALDRIAEVLSGDVIERFETGKTEWTMLGAIEAFLRETGRLS